jgi:hypothetical protein
MPMEMRDIQAIVAVGRVGLALAASRLMSLVSVFGTVGLGAYVISAPSWQGVAVVSLTAACAWTALRLETRGKNDAVGGQDG